MRVTFICPACHGAILAPATLHGESMPCPKCRVDVDRWPAPQPIAPLPIPAPRPTPPPLAAWHYSIDGVQRGPITAPELSRLVEDGSLRPTDFVWQPGWPAWVEAYRITGLFPPSPPPVLPPRERRPRPSHDDDDYDDRPRRRRRRRSNRDEGMGGLELLVTIGATIFIPFIGLLVGAMGLGSSSAGRRGQSAGILILAIVMMVLYYHEMNRRW